MDGRPPGKVRGDCKIQTQVLYLALGLTEEGRKEVLGMWLAETESASFWMAVLDELRQRVVEDILVTVTDNLTGLTQAIEGIFPGAVTQVCITHQIRNSLQYVAGRRKKPLWRR